VLQNPQKICSTDKRVSSRGKASRTHPGRDDPKRLFQALAGRSIPPLASIVGVCPDFAVVTLPRFSLSDPMGFGDLFVGPPSREILSRLRAPRKGKHPNFGRVRRSWALLLIKWVAGPTSSGSPFPKRPPSSNNDRGQRPLLKIKTGPRIGEFESTHSTGFPAYLVAVRGGRQALPRPNPAHQCQRAHGVKKRLGTLRRADPFFEVFTTQPHRVSGRWSVRVTRMTPSRFEKW